MWPIEAVGPQSPAHPRLLKYLRQSSVPLLTFVQSLSVLFNSNRCSEIAEYRVSGT